MNFKEEYKKSAEMMSPDRQTIDRMKAAVMAKLNEEPSEEEPKHKKPLPLKRIAFAGGAAAACALITISAVTVIPMIRKNKDMVSEAQENNSSTAASAADFGNGFADNAADAAMPENAAENNFDYSVTDVAESATCDEMYTCEGMFTYEDHMTGEGLPYDPNADAGNPMTGPGSELAEADRKDDDLENDNPECGNDNGIGNDLPDNNTPSIPATGATEDTPPAPEATEESGFVTLEPNGNITTEPTYTETMEIYDETCEYGTADAVTTEWWYTEETEEAAPVYENLLVITGKGWLTCNGVRYDQKSGAADPGLFGQTTQAYNAADGKYYAIYLENGTLHLYQNDGSFLGSFSAK